MKTLGDLLRATTHSAVWGEQGVEVTGVAQDTRSLRAGNVFVAVSGRRFDGNDFLEQALAKGAAAVVSERTDPPRGLGIPYVVVPSSARAVSQLSSAFYDFPARHLGMVGVTGTDGKTTTVHLIASILRAAGYATGSLSTVEVAFADRVERNPTDFTTPQAPDLQRTLAAMRASRAEFAVIEVSSHGLVTERVADCEFDVAVFTNLTPEHLDFHGTFEQYREAKTRLFTLLEAGVRKGIPKLGVINADDQSAPYFRRATTQSILSYGLLNRADVSACDVRLAPDGMRFRLVTPYGSRQIVTHLVGSFNVYNWLSAISAAVGLGVDLQAVEAAAAAVRQVPGRLQTVDRGQPFNVVVDFAHTPHALRSVLDALRAQTPGRLLVVFGHAGERDTANRPLMATTVAKLSDFFVITTDDPYGEDPLEIISQVEEGALLLGLRPGRDYVVLPDRREAITAVLTRARAGDTVLIAGRGHERFITIGSRKEPFDDVEVTESILDDLYGQPERPAIGWS